MNREELLELIPAYALDALEDDERTMLEALLENDIEAQKLLADYEVISSILPLATPVHAAPSHLKSDLQERLAKRQKANKIIKAAPSSAKKSLSSQYRLFISSAAALIVMFLGIFAYIKQNPEATREPKGLILYNEILAQSNYQKYEVTPTGAKNATGELVVSTDGSEAVLVIAQLPDLQEGQRYQLWLAREGNIESGGLYYWPTGQGPYYVVVPLDQPFREYIRFGMSIEPEAGSPLVNAPSGVGLFSVTVAQAG